MMVATEMIGKTFADFKIIRLIGKGNMAEVYLAHQNSLDREVALKIVKLDVDHQNVVDRLIQEAQIAGAIQHPNIINIYSVGKENSFAYIVMEYIEGNTLENLVVKSPLLEEEVWSICLQICHALKSAYNKGVIHRDIKPANIMLTTDGQVKVTDFGISKKEGDSKTTKKGIILGTPSYMSVEQASGVPVDFRTDIYSLGTTLYRLITGKLVFYADSILELINKHRHQKAIDPMEHVPDISYKTSFIIAKMIQKDPNDRYQTYDQIICDVQSFLEGKSIIYASEKDVSNVYLEKPIEKKIFFKTSRLTQKIVGNIQNIIQREQTEDETASEVQEHTSENKDLQETVTIDEIEIVKELQKYDPYSKNNRFFNLEKNISLLEKKLGKSFLNYLKDRKLITEDLLKKALDTHSVVNPKFGNIAVHEGLLLPEQVERILKIQKKIKKKFGELTIQMGFLTKDQVMEILDRQDRTHVDFYEVLMRENILDKETLEKTLLEFTMSF